MKKSFTVRALLSAALLGGLVVTSVPVSAQKLVPGGVHKQELEARRRDISHRVHEMRDHHGLRDEHYRRAMSTLDRVRADTHAPGPMTLDHYKDDQRRLDDLESRLHRWHDEDRHDGDRHDGDRHDGDRH